MASASRRVRTLRLVEDLGDQRRATATVSFCSHCGTEVDAPASLTRVCTSCGFGVVLETARELVPAPGGAFLVVDRSMSVCAVSAGAEELLGLPEIQAVHRHLTELLTPADTEAQNRGSLAFAISAAIRGVPQIKRFTLRPANLFGVRLSARIGSCGPRPGALIVLDR